MTVPSGSRREDHFVAIADGNAHHRSLVRGALLSFYRTVEYPDATRALIGLRVAPASVILVGEETPSGGGYALARQIKLDPGTAKLPVLMIVAHDDQATAEAVRQCGADGYLVKPYSRSTLIKAISSRLNAGVERQWDSLPPIQRQALKGTVEIFNSISDVIDKGEPLAYGIVSDACSPLVEAVNKKDFKSILNGVKDHDNYSYAHSLRVATLLSLFGHTIGLPQSEQLLLASGGLLHDVGKMAIPHEILNKPGRLTPEEFAVMKGHVAASVHHLKLGGDIPKGIITIAEQHHEKLDGTGYPNNLPGAKLNPLARMASIVDVFSALTDRRVYKPPMEAEKALSIMTDEMSTHLDLGLLALFREMLLDAAVDTAA